MNFIVFLSKDLRDYSLLDLEIIFCFLVFFFAFHNAKNLAKVFKIIAGLKLGFFMICIGTLFLYIEFEAENLILKLMMAVFLLWQIFDLSSEWGVYKMLKNRLIKISNE